MLFVSMSLRSIRSIN